MTHLDNLNDLFLPIDLYSEKPQRKSIMNIANHIKEGKTIIFFPAGVVSRFRDSKVQDVEWTRGAVNFGRKYKAPIICAKIDNRNSALFYILTKMKDRLAPFLFPREMFKFRGKKLKVNFGKLIDSEVYDSIESDEELTILLRKYVYNLDGAPKELVNYFRD